MYPRSSESLLMPYKDSLQRPPLPPNALKMCTPWALRKLSVRRHLGDGHRSLSISRFRQEDASNRPVIATTLPSRDNDRNTGHQHGLSKIAQPSSPMLVTRYDHSGSNEAPSRVSVVKRGKHKRRVTIGSNQTSSSCISLGDVNVGQGGAEESDWPPFTDEDYIVFSFEEDGDFHVVMEENSKSQDSSEHRPLNQKSQGDGEGEASRRDCFLPNKAVEEELFYFSPRSQSDGIKSLTRFKAEVGDGDSNIVQARGRVDEDMDYEDIYGVKNRGQCSNEEDDLECHETSMEGRDGYVESTEETESNWALQQLHLTKNDQEVSPLSFSRAQENPSSSQMGKLEIPSGMVSLWSMLADEGDSVYLSSESQQGGSHGDDESERASAEIVTSRSEIEEVQLEEDGEEALDSECSRSSSGSFKFPVLEWEWTGSPVKWPTANSFRLRKPKSRRVCLRCCRF